MGQSVDLIPRVIRQAAKGSYEIIRLMPENENDPRYCVKRAAERYERVVREKRAGAVDKFRVRAISIRAAGVSRLVLASIPR